MASEGKATSAKSFGRTGLPSFPSLMASEGKATRVLQEADRLVTLFPSLMPSEGKATKRCPGPRQASNLFPSLMASEGKATHGRQVGRPQSRWFPSLMASEGKATHQLRHPAIYRPVSKPYGIRRESNGRVPGLDSALVRVFPSLTAFEGRATNRPRRPARCPQGFQALRHLKGEQHHTPTGVAHTYYSVSKPLGIQRESNPASRFLNSISHLDPRFRAGPFRGVQISRFNGSTG